VPTSRSRIPSPLTSDIATDGALEVRKEQRHVGPCLRCHPALNRRRLTFDPGIATAYVETSGMTLMVAIRPLSRG
jgi:hypothetical protein